MTPAQLVAAGVLDARLAALLRLLADAGVPLIVSGNGPVDLATAMAPDRRWDVIEPGGLWGEALVERVRGLRVGQTFVATARSDSLRDLMALLGSAGLGDDEIRALGVAVFLDPSGRVAAAHYLRPAERDVGGHVQRRPPAVLAARDPSTGELEDFSWAITPELAVRVGSTQAEFEERIASLARSIAAIQSNGASLRPS